MVRMGRIVGVHGIRGWVKVESYAQPREGLIGYSPWRVVIDGQASILKVVDAHADVQPLKVQLGGIDSRDAAQALIGAAIEVAREALPASGPDEFYWSDLEGMQVVTTEGVALGSVSHLVATGANDVLVVKQDRQERLIPFTPGHAVVAVDKSAGTIEVDWDPDF